MTDWRGRLDGFFAVTQAKQESAKETDLSRFIFQVVNPAFQDIRDQLTRHGRQITIRETESSVTMLVHDQGKEEFCYRIHGRLFPHGVLPYAEVRFKERKGLKIIRVESMLRSGSPDYRMGDIRPDEVIQHFLDHYMRAVNPD